MRAWCIVAAVALVLAAAPARADTVLRPGATASGALAAGDSTLQGGEFVDVFAFEGKAGQRLVVTMTSEAFDAYLLIAGPANFREENDDADNGANCDTGVHYGALAGACDRFWISGSGR
jgi:hypothetical protein